ncbi:MarR family transcriptional regulator [Actinopolymorpha sp. B17G11]|uniref:MarR family winged helix-turn-helix transcriptional regulator n=1 Tax=unclassified Actinopolymorpha TaxID=2627063 RepID=UPI0032D99BA1
MSVESSRRQKQQAALGQLLQLAMLINEDMEHGLGRVGLTPSRATLVWELLHRGPSTQRVLAGAIGVSPRNVTGLVDALVDTGFVVREPHPTDRRAALVSFTEHGARIAEQLKRDGEQLADDLFADMPDRQFSALVRGFDVLMARLCELIAEAKEKEAQR